MTLSLRRPFVGLITLLTTGLGLAVAVVPTTASASTCDNPTFTTSDRNGMWGSGKYVVHNNMWNVSGYNVSETLRACRFDNWSVTANASNASGDGAVKTYPNVHQDFHNWSTGSEPRLSSFRTIRSSFAMRAPDVGIYDVAYDIWLDGVPGRHEIMFWTDNRKQVPAGSIVARGRSFAGRTWTVWATGNNSIISFVPDTALTSGTIGIKRQLNWLTAQGRINANATLGQICYGVEVVSTGGQPARFKLDDFSVSTTRR